MAVFSPLFQCLRIASVASLLVAVSVTAHCAWAQDDDLEALYAFLQGPYEVIGRRPDSRETYSGKVILKMEGNGLKVIRRIGSTEVVGSGTIETALAGSVRVLRVRFVQSRQRFEATYLIDSDLDNYARLTGYVYREAGGTRQPGLEALFIHREALQDKQ